ncbi:GAF domain-containing protein [Planktothrix sp.]|uniref:sensor histidine kinase n=2 Tax=Planktothrix sp. TaxID=3088171 RepID=UPI0038D35DB4
MGQSEESITVDKPIMTLGRILQTLQDEDHVDVLIETTLDYLKTEFNYSLIWIGLYDRLDHRLLGKGGIIPTEDSWLLKQRFTLSPGDLLEQVVIELRPVVVPDLREEIRAGEWRKAAQAFNIQGSILFPMRYKDRCFGVVLLGSSEWGISPSSMEKELISMVLGALAASLFQIETTWIYQQTKRPEQPFFKLLTQFRTLNTLDRCLEAAVETTHEFIEPTRTNVYWYYREGRYFWRRASNQQKLPGVSLMKQAASGVTVQDLGEFYQALISDHLVSIGESYSSLRADTTERLMEKIRARSLLAVPILFNQEMLGFIAVEGQHPRIWQENEKHFLRGVAHLISLTAPLAEMEAKIRQIELDQSLTAKVTRAIVDDHDWQFSLKTTAHLLCQRLNTGRFLLIKYQDDIDKFEIIYQHYPLTRMAIPSPLNSLSYKDLESLKNPNEILVVENCEEDDQLKAWRNQLRDAGVRSLILCPVNDSIMTRKTSSDSGPQEFLLIAHEAPRTWDRAEQELVKIVSQQLSVILHQWQLNQQIKFQEKFNQILEDCFSIQKKTDQLQPLEKQFTEKIAEFLQSPLVVLVTWLEGARKAKIVSCVARKSELLINSNRLITVAKDPLIQHALSTEELFWWPVQELGAYTRQWFTSSVNKILVATLRTATNHQPTGLLIIADPDGEISLKTLNVLVMQLAWSRRYLRIQDTLTTQQKELQWLNWYKQRRLEELYRTVGGGLKQLNELNNSPFQGTDPQKNQLSHLRYQQLLRQIGNALASTSSLIKQEQWRLHHHHDIIPITNLLRWVRERLNSIIRNKEIQFILKQEGNFNIIGDRIKLELVCYEILLTICYRTEPGGLIEVVSRLFNDHQLELLITDYGKINPQLIVELKVGFYPDLLAPSLLTSPPGQQLLICQQMLEKMGGDLLIEQSDNQVVITRIILPLYYSN